MELSDKTALVTGATSGIGTSAAIALADLGAKVIVSGRNAERGEAVVKTIRDRGGEAHFAAADLTEVGAGQKLGREALDLADGRIDILVNNAGIYPFAPVSDVTEDDLRKVYETNVFSSYTLTQTIVPQMIERGSGSIINVTTGLAQKGFPGASVYASSKGAMEAVTRAWATEFGPSGVRVNAVAPGLIVTPGTDAQGDGVLEIIKGDPAGRPGQPEEIAAAITYLASDAASYVYGVVLAVDGGSLAS